MKKYAPLLIILAGCLWGTMGLFVRRLNSIGLASMEIVEVRSIIAALILFPVVALRDRGSLKIKLNQIWPVFGTGVFSMVFFNFCYFSTIAQMNLSAAAILLYTAPIFVMLLSLILFREQLTARKVFALILAFSGCCLVSGIASATASLSLRGLILGLGSGFGYALYSIFSRFGLNRGLNSTTITVYTFLFAALGGAFFTDFPALAHVIAANGFPLILFLIFYCAVTTILPYLFYTKGLTYVENGPASVMASVEPVVATLLGLIVFSESLTLSALLGMILVLGALVLLSISPAKAPQSAEE